MTRVPYKPFGRPRRFRVFGQGPFFYWAMFTRMAERSWPSVMSALAAQAFFTATGVVLPMLLGREAFGDYQTILSVIRWPLILALFPIGAVLPRFLSHHRDDPDALRDTYGAAFTICLIAVAVSLLTLVVAGLPLMRLYRVEDYPGTTLGLAVGSLAIHPLALFFMSVLQGYGRSRTWAFINIAGVALVCAIVIAGTGQVERFGMGALGVAGLVCWLPYGLMSARAARRIQGYLFVPKAAWTGMRELAGAAYPMLVSTAAVFASHSYFAWLLVDRLADGKVEVGYFFLTFGSFFTVVIVAFGGLSIPLLPEWARKYRDRRYGRLVRAFDGALVISTLAGGAFGLGLYFGADWIVATLYGPEYAPLADSLRMAAWWCPLYMIGASFFLLGVAMGKTGKVMWANLALGVVSSVAAWFLADRGSRGICEAMMIGYVVWTVVYAVMGIADIRAMLRARAARLAAERARSEGTA